MKIGYYFYFNNVISIFSKQHFKGWGRKNTGRFAQWCYKIFSGTLILKEDGFIRSLDLGINNSPPFSLVEDNIGIYYDVTVPSKLENILNTYDFNADKLLLKKAKEAIELIENYHISKYNNAPNVRDSFFKDDEKKRVLIIAQTAGDASLEYGLGNKFTTKQMIDEAMNENLNAS
ncbi:MAG: Capsular polysaccharide export system protein KpsC, partial [uncultured Sulfurovum sp.]